VLDTRRGGGDYKPKAVFGMPGSMDFRGFTEMNSVAKTISGFRCSFPVVVNVNMRTWMAFLMKTSLNVILV